MFLFHITLPLGLIALTGGLALYIWGLRAQGIGTAMAKVFGLIIVVLSILEVLCVLYWGVRFWEFHHQFSGPMPMMQQQQPPQQLPMDHHMEHMMRTEEHRV